MTSVYIIIGLILLTCALICYIFIKQTIVKHKRQKARLFSALEKRSKEFLQMLNAFPPHFLPKDISVFLYRCIVDVFEQLSKLEPGRPELLEQFTLYSTALETTMRQPVNNHQVRLQNTNQINEIRQYLNYLSRFMQKWVERGNLSSKQYQAYKVTLKNLAAKLMIDNYMLSATKSDGIGKNKLATHYFTLAKNMITKEGLVNTQKDDLAHINEELARLGEFLKLEDEAADKVQEDINTSVTDDIDNDNDEWSSFNDNEGWQKKNVYD
jgi:hypothetical protein